MSYVRFGAMIATSTIVMFGLMYLNTYALDHVLFSQTRAWMALLMGATMSAIMRAFMLKMYSNRGANVAIFAGAVAGFCRFTLARPEPGDRFRCFVHESDYSASFDCHHDKRKGSYSRSAGQRTRRWNH
ncbi:hypothetical protein BH10PLA2_BH10PLA2_29120 [soil metagenome]